MSSTPARLWLSAASLAAGALIGTNGHPFGGMILVVPGAGLLFLRRRPTLVLVGLLCVSAGCGYIGSALRARDGRDLEASATQVMRCSVAGRVLEQAGGLGTLVALDALDCRGTALPSGVAVVSATERLASGAQVSGEGWIIPLGTDRFARQRARAGARVVFEPIELEVADPRGFWTVVDSLRAGVAGAARDGLPRRHGALMLGLTIGDTSGLSAWDMELFRASGLAHILAVSGSNVAIVLGAIGAVTRRATYRFRFFATFAAAALFVAIVGPDASVLRAAAMGTVAFVAGGWVRPVDPMHSLPFALLCLLAARPWMVDSAGLHLSVAATAGIVLWSVPLSAWLNNALPAVVAVPLAVTLAAQAAVAPILILVFGTLPLLAPVANLLAAPAVVFGTLTGMGVTVIGAVAPMPAAWLAASARPALAWLLWVAELCGQPSWAQIELPRAAGWAALVAVLGLALGTLRRRNARS